MRSYLPFIAICLYASSWTATVQVSAAPTPTSLKDECGHTLIRPSSFFKRHFDLIFLKKFFKHWVPFTSSARVKLHYFLYKRDFPECGREMFTDDDASLAMSGFDAQHPTRIIIHGWMSQSRGSLNRAVKNAYLSLTRPRETAEEPQEISTISPDILYEYYNDASNNNYYDEATQNPRSNYSDFNIIVCDWSVISSNVNYFGVVDMIEDLGFLLAEFVRYLHMRAGLQFDDVYLIGHSLGAQIAGSAGKQVAPFRFNTIYALDPAGPKFRGLPAEFRIDASDAHYVESIHTSSTFGFEEPVGHAAFYPNFGKDQKKCYIYGCSHSRAHKFFAESITSEKGFWGTRAERQGPEIWVVSESGEEFRMGGEPSIPKNGTFYVKTNDKPPYAMGRRQQVLLEFEEQQKEREFEYE